MRFRVKSPNKSGGKDLNAMMLGAGISLYVHRMITDFWIGLGP